MREKTHCDPRRPSFLSTGDRPTTQHVFSEGVTLLSASADTLPYLLSALEDEILPALERHGVPDLGAMFLEHVLAQPAVATQPGFALPLLMRLGRYHAELRDVPGFVATWNRAVALERQSPSPRVIQDLLLSRARLRMYTEPAQAAADYRLAIATAGSDPALLFQSLTQSIRLAVDVGHYQDVVDFTLIGLAISDRQVADAEVMNFLATVLEEMPDLGRFDLGASAFALYQARLPRAHSLHTPGNWAARVWLAAARLYALVGDADASKQLLARMVPPSAAELPGITLPGTPDRALILGRVYRQLGDLARAETYLHTCLDLRGAIRHRHILGAECHAELVRLYETLDDVERASAHRGSPSCLAPCRVYGPSAGRQRRTCGLACRGRNPGGRCSQRPSADDPRPDDSRRARSPATAACRRGATRRSIARRHD